MNKQIGRERRLRLTDIVDRELDGKLRARIDSVYGSPQRLVDFFLRNMVDEREVENLASGTITKGDRKSHFAPNFAGNFARTAGLRERMT